MHLSWYKVSSVHLPSRVTAHAAMTQSTSIALLKNIHFKNVGKAATWLAFSISAIVYIFRADAVFVTIVLRSILDMTQCPAL